MKKFSILITIVFPLFFAGCTSQNDQQAETAKYVFLFIGDGMGIQQVNTTQAFLSAIDSVIGNTPLTFTEFPVTGFLTTFSGTRYITCSAAAGTAMATGHKTSPGTIGLNADHSDSLYSIAYWANKAGYPVGIVTSVSIDHATPAAFYGHQTSRSKYHEMGHDLIGSGYRFFASGGFRDPEGKKSKEPRGNFLEMGAELGILFTSSLSLTPEEKEMHSTIVFSDPNPAESSTLQYAIDAQPADITLAQITKMGIDVLDNPKGFFMMVEGGKIDWACHDNDATTTIYETISLSDAVAEAFDFYQKHPTETLIVVTADHETGGMSLGTRTQEYESNLAILANQRVSLERFEKHLKALEAQKERNPSLNEVLGLVNQFFGLGTPPTFLSDSERELLQKAYTRQYPKEGQTGSKKDAKMAIAKQAAEILNQKAGIGWTTYSHTGSQVPIYAIGAGQERFKGQLDNTQLVPIIGRLMGIPVN